MQFRWDKSSGHFHWRQLFPEKCSSWCQFVVGSGAAVGRIAAAGSSTKHGGVSKISPRLGGTPGDSRGKKSPKAGTAHYGLYVLPDDLDAAKEIDRAHWLKGAPEHASSYRYTAQELKGACPACETALPEGAAECPECGLTVGATETAECPACEADVPADAEKCPNCGAEFE